MPQRWRRFLGTYSMVSEAKGMGMRLSISIGLSSFIIACAQQPPTPPHPITCPGVTSPDQQLRACALSVGRPTNPPFHDSSVEMRDMRGAVLATKSLKSADGEHGPNAPK